MYSQEKLTQIEQLASLYMKPSEIALIIGVEAEVFKSDIAVPGSPAYTAYSKGKITQKLEVHKQMAMLARVGSPLALEQSQRALLDMEDDE